MSYRLQQKIESPDLIVACDGTFADSPHPRVFLKKNKQGWVVCPYCSACYVMDISKADEKID